MQEPTAPSLLRPPSAVPLSTVPPARDTAERGTAGGAGRTPPAYGTVVAGGGALPSLSASSGSSRAWRKLCLSTW